MVINFLRICHSFVITLIIWRIVQRDHLSPIFMYAELGFTIFRAILEKKASTNHFKVQIVLSLVLGYYVFPNKLGYISWLFFFKAIEIHQSLKAIRISSVFLNKSGIFRYIAFFYDFLRYSVYEYIVLGIIMMVYQYLTNCRSQPLPHNYAILYQLIVTASTIGYGDVVPKSE